VIKYEYTGDLWSASRLTDKLCDYPNVISMLGVWCRMPAQSRPMINISDLGRKDKIIIAYEALDAPSVLLMGIIIPALDT
jgi:hypothetical protein